MWRIWLFLAVLLAGLSPASAQAPSILCVQGPNGCVPVNSANPLPVTGATGSGTYTIVPLDANTVTTGGTAVVALSGGHRTRGGWLQNPAGAAQSLCINEAGTASGTVSNGNTTCIAPGQNYSLAPSGNAVSVISSDSAHGFSGYGYE
jgi:hypothetical protein